MVLLLNQEALKQFNGLSETALLQGILKNLDRQCRTKSGRQKRIQFKKPVDVEIARDSWYYDEKIGTMSYAELYLMKFGNKLWALSVGTKSGAYPGSTVYASDIIALPFAGYDQSGKNLDDFFAEQIMNSKYFKSTLLIGMTSGYIATADSSIFGHNVPSLTKSVHNLTVNEARQNTKFMNLDGAPIYDLTTTYKPEAIKAFADSIAFVLANC